MKLLINLFALSFICIACSAKNTRYADYGPYICKASQLTIKEEYVDNIFAGITSDSFDFYVDNKLTATTRSEYVYEESTLELTLPVTSDFEESKKFTFLLDILTKTPRDAHTLSDCLLKNLDKVYKDIKVHTGSGFTRVIKIKEGVILRRVDDPGH